MLSWNQIDFARGRGTGGQIKNKEGCWAGDPHELAVRIVLEFWAERFPNHKLNHYVFPRERHGGSGRDDEFGFAGAVAYNVDHTKPIGDWKEAWEAAKIRAGVTCRFHDLRHTGCIRMLEKGVPLRVVVDIIGWSASTMAKMGERYGHIGNQARRAAIDALSSATTWDSEGAQIWAQSKGNEKGKERQVQEKNGSSGRTRTYNPPVNSRMLCH